MIVHVALDGVLEGALGLGLDLVGGARRLARAGMGATPGAARALVQRVVSVEGAAVRSLQGRAVAVDGPLDVSSLGPGDVVVVPGVFAPDEAAIGRVLARTDVRKVVDTLPEVVARGASVAASCSATFLLGAAGLLDGKSATTTWWLIAAFAKRFPAVELRADRMVVEGGGVLTAGAAFAHADLVLAVIARAATPALADLAARYLVLDSRATQGRYMVLEHLGNFDPMLQKVEAFVAANLDRQLGLAELARAAGTSPRTLARRVEAAAGLTPLGLVQRIRVAHAAHLLETTRASVEEVAERVGYADAAAFRRVFRQHTGDAPRHRHPRAAEAK